MKTQTPEAVRAYFNRVTPIIPELFNMAHAICGNYDLAEYALQYALMEAWVGEFHGGMGFREGIRNVLRSVALEEALEPRPEELEFTWNGLAAGVDEPLLQMAAQESVEVRRIIALRYGCGFSNGRIARLMGVPQRWVREAMDRFERRAGRRLSGQDRRRFDMLMSKAVRREFERMGSGVPAMGAVYRSFESEVAEVQRPRHILARSVRRIVCILLVLACALVFWLTAVLIRPVEVPHSDGASPIEEFVP